LLQESSRQNYLAAFITWLSPIGHHEEVFSGEAYAAIVLKPLHKYGYPIRWLVIFMAAVGLPLPTSLVLLAAGAFAAHGDFNIALLMGITIAAASCGDSVGYFIGRCWGSKTLDWLGKPRRLKLISARTITRSRHYFKCKSGWAIFFSRFLFSALGGVMNLLAGAERYPYHGFLLYDLAGWEQSSRFRSAMHSQLV